MSIELLNQAFDADLNMGPKLVLLVLSDYAGKDGSAWPSQRTICRRSGLGRSSVKRHTKDLEDMGYITRELGFRYGNQVREQYTYMLHPEKWVKATDDVQEKEDVGAQPEVSGAQVEVIGAVGSGYVAKKPKKQGGSNSTLGGFNSDPTPGPISTLGGSNLNPNPSEEPLEEPSEELYPAASLGVNDTLGLVNEQQEKQRKRTETEILASGKKNGPDHVIYTADGLYDVWRGLMGKYYPESWAALTGDERYMLQQFNKQMLGEAGEILAMVIRDWIPFANAAEEQGAFHSPLMPRINYLLKFSKVAFDLFRSKKVQTFANATPKAQTIEDVPPMALPEAAPDAAMMEKILSGNF